MDHLYCPNNHLSLDWETIPYVCAEEYDGGPFLTYPLRVGKPQAIPSEGYIRFAIYEHLHPTPLKELEAFLQNWLFFGLLREVLGDLYRHDDFISTLESEGNSQRFLSTSKLLELLDAWDVRLKDSLHNKSQMYIHLAECLRVAQEALSTTLEKAGFDPRIKGSIAAVGEILVSAMERALWGHDKGHKLPRLWGDFFEPSWLKDAGWCPAEVMRSTRTFNQFQTLIFFSKMSLPSNKDKHRSCTEQQCLAHETNLGDYQPKHVTNSCDCEELTIEFSTLNNLLEEGQLPLLRIKNSQSIETIAVEVEAFQGNLRYVAISHVWADGLGNPVSNSLPRCQLQALSQKVSTLENCSIPEIEQEKNIIIWLDTLCCPVQRGNAKNIALSQMRQTYEDATWVLVLDSSIQACDLNHVGVYEALARIFTSRWMRRLWTLQEAALAKQLVFQFASMIVNLHSLVMKIRPFRHSHLYTRGLDLDIFQAYHSLKIFSPGTLGYYSRSNIGDLAKALQYRQVTVASDEPLCLATLLNLKVDKIIQGPDEQRMHRLWLQMPFAYRGIPQNIIFNSGPKLKEKGYRWAISTFLVRTKRLYNIILTSEDVGLQGSPTPEGLLVQICGREISFPGVPQGLPRAFLRLLDVLLNKICYVKDTNDHWYAMTIRDNVIQAESVKNQKKRTMHDLIQEDSEDCTVLTASSSDQLSIDGICHAVFAKCLHMQDGVTFAETRATSTLSRRSRLETEMMKAVDQCAQALLRDESTLSTIGKESFQNEEDINTGLATLERFIRIKTEEALRDATINDIVTRCSIEGLEVKTFGRLITYLYLGQYAIITRTFDNEKWCVD